MSRPAAAPCRSCPYRLDVPSGVWAEEEYAKLPPYDLPTWEQPQDMFYCHQQDGAVCAGWAGTHDMAENFGLRVAATRGFISPEDYAAILDYESPVPLFASGQEAAEHGLAEIKQPGASAQRTIARITQKLQLNSEPLKVVDRPRCRHCRKTAPWCSCGKADYSS